MTMAALQSAAVLMCCAMLCCAVLRAFTPPPRFIYSAFLTVICLLCPAIIIWLDPWTWGLWRPEMMFLVSCTAGCQR